MSRIALLLPQRDLYEKVRSALEGIEFPHTVQTEYISSVDDSIEIARRLADSCDLFIVRGRVSHFIRSTLSLPVVNIEITPREMGMFFLQAKQRLQKPRPRIDVVCYRNSICDTTGFSEIFDIDLRCHLVDPSREPEAVTAAADAAIADGAEFIIGSGSAITRAEAASIPALRLYASEVALRDAFRIADITLYAHNLEKANAMRLQALIDNLYCAVIELDRDERVVMFNTVAEKEFGFHLARDGGKPLSGLTHAIPTDIVGEVIRTGQERFVPGIRSETSILLASITPIFSAGEVSGAIILCQKAKTVESMDLASRRESYKPVGSPFDLERMRPFLEDCPNLYQSFRLFSVSDAPLLLSGESGCEAPQIAMAIHSAGSLANEPFIEIPVSELREEDQLSLLFGRNDENGILLSTHHGTILLNRADLLSLTVQRRILRILQQHTVLTGKMTSVRVSVRIIAYIPDPFAAMENGRLDREFYYSLNILQARIPPLRDRPRDLAAYAAHYIQSACEKFRRIVALTAEASEAIREYPWPGNLTQLSAFCEKLVFSAPHRSISGADVRSLLTSTYPEASADDSLRTVARQTEEQRIRDALQRMNWNRAATARELQISTTTLWRKMNQYGILR